MEFSSPLAAMQPSSYAGTWGCRRGMPAARPKFSTVRNCGNGSFNFNELSMKSSSDYFAVRSIRGSSPAASLAADLSQNFHIDQTLVAPNIPTIALKSAKVFPPASPANRAMQSPGRHPAKITLHIGGVQM